MRKQWGWVLAYIVTICGVLTAVHWGNRTVTVIAEQIPVARQHWIIVDAGHGGEDGGAVSCTGRPESEYNLEIAQRLGDFLSYLGYGVKLTRNSSEAVSAEGETIAQRKLSDLRARAAFIGGTESPILISIHQNQFTEPQYHGAQVFYADTKGSKALAGCLQKQLKECLDPANNRKIKRCSGVYLMRNITCPGILVECGFLSNIQDEKQLADPNYQKKLCCTIGTVLDEFLRHA